MINKFIAINRIIILDDFNFPGAIGNINLTMTFGFSPNLAYTLKRSLYRQYFLK